MQGYYKQRDMDHNNIKAILSVCPMINLYNDKFSHMIIEARDDDEELLIDHFMDAINFIESTLKKFSSYFFIHCVAGVSRSSTIVVSYIMWKYKIGWKQAMAIIKTHRNIIDPNHSFRCQLALFEKMNCMINDDNEEYLKLKRSLRKSLGLFQFLIQ